MNWWNSVRALAATVDSEYINWENRAEAVNLAGYLSPVKRSPSPPVDSEPVEDRIQSLYESVESPSIEKLSEADTENLKVAGQVCAVLAVGATLADVEAQTPHPPYDEVSEELSAAVSALRGGQSGAEHIENAAERMEEIVLIVPTADTILEELTDARFGNPNDDAERVRERVLEALSDGDVEKVIRLHRSVVVGVWEKSDFDEFGYREFERLVADLYEEQGYETQQMEQGPDGGIDVIAERGGSAKLIQVKHRSDTISAPEVDQYVSLLEYHDPDEVVIVTSSSFTQPALDRCRHVSGQVQPIDGEQLRRLLTETEMVPPI